MDESALVEWLATARHDDLRLRPPPLREGMIYRAALVDRLLASQENRIVTVVAPAGYGKTTLMAQWLEQDTRPTAWLSVDRSDNDPASLLAHIVAALRYAGMVTETGLAQRMISDRVISHGVPEVVARLEAHSTTGVLMLDSVESLHSRASNDVIAELAGRMPPAVQLVIASRMNVRLPISILRIQGVLLELTASELAMDQEEARTLLSAAGIHAPSEIAELMSHTEGWPVGLYLAGLAAKSGSIPRSRPSLMGGDDRFVADYLRSEVLEHFSDVRVSFLTRTAVLERFCGPLCDAVLRTAGSARTIERLEGSNLLIVPLDRTRTWYRYHHLLREFLQAELRRREPEAIIALNIKAAEWFDANAMPEPAISHALAADDLDLAARIMSRVMRPVYGKGRADTVFEWMRRLDGVNQIGHHPAVSAIGALAYALSGDEAAAERWAGPVMSSDVSPGENLPEPAWILRAVLMRDGTAQARADARAARADPEWLAAALELEGLSYLWDGDAEQADALLARAVAAGEWFSAAPSATSALAARAVIAIDRGDWETASQHAGRSLQLIRTHGLEQYLTSGLGFAVASRCASKRNEMHEARQLLAQATTIRPRLTSAAPGISVQTQLEMAAAHVELGDIAGARLVLREASDILAKRHDLGLLSRQYEQIKTRLQALATTAVGAMVLTTAELRLLPYLTTHLSFPEIGERLYVSRHTVKTQAMSIYRKFGASSRSEAVQRAREFGLLTG
jgi:LuxR family maltose regulon positive regulatory protein